MTDGDGHPLALIAPASHWFLNTIFANKPDLMKQGGRAADHAAPRRRRRARADDRRQRPGLQRPRRASTPASRSPTWSAPGVIASTKGHWLKNVRGGANVNATTEERDADMGGGAIYHDNRVEVERASVSVDDLGPAERSGSLHARGRAAAVRLPAR